MSGTVNRSGLTRPNCQWKQNLSQNYPSLFFREKGPAFAQFSLFLQENEEINAAVLEIGFRFQLKP
jgi:hypothetical protein